jgi:hypothetical protein
MSEGQGSSGLIDTGLEEAAAYVANASKGAAATASVDTGFDTTPVAATVSPALAPTPETVDTGFDDLGVTTAPVQQGTPTVNTVADTGKPKDPDTDLDARVAALLPNNSITDWNAVSAFMANVVPWPGSPQDAGYINLHMRGKLSNPKDPKKDTYIGGWPYKDVDEFIGRGVNTIVKNSARYLDAWFCLSQQSTATKTRNGNLKAERKARNATAAKAIWVDIDVGNDPKKYADIPTALNAILTFQVAVGLPPPSAIVHSGGGLHVYWISDKVLLPHEWAQYASGLKHLLLANNIKCDSGLTTDIARILRVPGTKNYKYDPPREVKLADNLPLRMYDFTTQLQMLPPLAGQIKTPPATAAKSIFWEGITDAQRATFDTPAPWSFPDEPGLDAGIDKFADILLDPHPIFTQCGFYLEALKNGGKNNDQPQWNLAILGTTFMERGNEIAHRISKDHVAYAEADTQAMFDRKLAERSDRGIGYPSCAAIKGAGCKACETCPLSGKIKSPLNLRIARATEKPSDTDDAAAGASASQSPELKISFSNIPHRQWLYGIDLVRGDITLLASPGGAGKTSLALGEAICLATARKS